ncbi:ABC transporter substrate-binding protein [Microbulbifer sp. THAF38]|uniref:ABC transporter substrate-binding protein n=1 Tax=Microbulbifer sp. THAF38 TaxID=2587856 RepID=UPI001267A592|nr:ABC transporter substrate-binding protein [Microbulbifer sp. THAF38]QFT56436.1 vitamin B12-transporter protein BtuF [Microbulbifer sp. THAF38]
MSTRTSRRHLLCWQLLLGAVFILAAKVQAYERIASLNLCLDQVLLNWAQPADIASLTWLSAAEQYRSLPIPEHVQLNRARAEELLPLKPDLVLAGQYGAQRAAERLQSLGVNVVTIPDAYNLEQLQQQLDALEAVLGPLSPLQQQKRALAQLLDQPAAKQRASAVILSANNITYGSGMLEHQLLQRAGFDNLASAQGLARISLEEVIALQPDLLVFYGSEQHFALAYLAARHPVLQRYIDSGRTYTLPKQLSLCPVLAIVDTLQQLMDKREALVKAQ